MSDFIAYIKKLDNLALTSGGEHIKTIEIRKLSGCSSIQVASEKQADYRNLLENQKKIIIKEKVVSNERQYDVYTSDGKTGSNKDIIIANIRGDLSNKGSSLTLQTTDGKLLEKETSVNGWDKSYCLTGEFS